MGRLRFELRTNRLKAGRNSLRFPAAQWVSQNGSSKKFLKTDLGQVFHSPDNKSMSQS
jgi:hypothetical protein